MRYTGSRTIWLQQLGRGLRKTPNKDYVYVLDFVGSLERLNEIKELAKAVDNVPLDEASLVDDGEPKLRRCILHDSTIEVKYSEEAAKVLTLLEHMKMQLNSREIVIDRIRTLKEKTNNIPVIEDLERCLPDVSLDQIATHFGSYYNFLLAAFGQDFDCKAMVERIRKFVADFSVEQKVSPSFRAITYNFMHHQLFEFTEREIKHFLPLLELEQSNPKSLEVEYDNVEVTQQMKCELIEQYKDKINSRSDLKLISDSDQQRIKVKYRSVSVFLKKLKEVV